MQAYVVPEEFFQAQSNEEALDILDKAIAAAEPVCNEYGYCECEVCESKLGPGDCREWD